MLISSGQKLNNLLCFLRDLKDKIFFPVARLVPQRISPNNITLFRLVITLLYLPFAFYNPHWSFVLVFVFVFLLDLLDGAVARLKNQVTYLGTKLDPFSDRLNHIALYGLVYNLLPFPLPILRFFIVGELFFCCFLVVEYFSKQEVLIYIRMALQFAAKVILWSILLIQIYQVYL
jgi:phosphatidylglycerophosphate synthase